ncbi:MAG: 4-(cytidine 5'-diphospho)-2-C-methyl-D-erythritol kinase [Verrucomicrobia bacterium]|nr:4-(cytidine 5'-diphospho)-2-C-methyl-D-erythritol kinase [Verrucomicrobiota bacterium]
MTVERSSPCKVNLLLNILGKRSDGFHELETLMQPVRVCDHLQFSRLDREGVELTCDNPTLPIDSTNLVHRAATAFFQAASLRGGVRIHLQKRVPLAAGLGGGSSNAANTLLGLNELFGFPLAADRLTSAAASLGSDVPFFLQPCAALATGRGERIVPLDALPALHGAFILLIYPGFGISTAWAYGQLARFPEALNGEPGRGQKLIALLQEEDLSVASKSFYNSLEAPALKKYPLLVMFQEFLRSNGATATLMSGSGSTTFAITRDDAGARALAEMFKRKFGETHWLAVVPL